MQHILKAGPRAKVGYGQQVIQEKQEFEHKNGLWPITNQPDPCKSK
jgi:hypothetical protein